MTLLIKEDNALDSWCSILRLIKTQGENDRSILEIMNLVVEISNPGKSLVKAKRICKGIIGSNYFNRTDLLYRHDKDLSWKYSYKKKLTNWDGRYNQLADISRIMKKSPHSKALCATILHPKDLKRAYGRSSSVPCPIAIDFKYRQKQIYFNVFFRSQDVLNLFIPDLWHLLKLMRETMQKANLKEHTKEIITFYLASAFIKVSDYKKINMILKLCPKCAQLK